MQAINYIFCFTQSRIQDKLACAYVKLYLATPSSLSAAFLAESRSRVPKVKKKLK